MSLRLSQRIGYSRAEIVSDTVVHAIGLAGALLAVPLLISRSWATGVEAAGLAGIAIYGLTLIAMILCSTLYNMAHPEGWTPVLRRMDHGAIYLKIAGTYTAFGLLSPNQTGWFLIWIWGCAALGIGLRTLASDRWRGVAIGLYLVMGWSGAVAGGALFGGMSPSVFALILGGGLIYTAGFAFFVSPRLRFHRTIWHLFVIVASGFFYAAVATHVALHAAGYA